MKIKPLNQMVLVEPKIEEATQSGIVLSNNDKKTNLGLVLAAEKDSIVKEGEEVIFRMYSQMIEPVKLDNKELILIPQDDILAVVTP